MHTALQMWNREIHGIGLSGSAQPDKYTKITCCYSLRNHKLVVWSTKERPWLFEPASPSNNSSSKSSDINVITCADVDMPSNFSSQPGRTKSTRSRLTMDVDCHSDRPRKKVKKLLLSLESFSSIASQKNMLNSPTCLKFPFGRSEQRFIFIRRVIIFFPDLQSSSITRHPSSRRRPERNSRSNFTKILVGRQIHCGLNLH